MIKQIRDWMHKIASYMELIVAVIIIFIIAVSIISMIVHIAQNPFEIQDSEQFLTFMNDALSLIIGIEFLKMIIIPTSGNVIETLVFAVSRHIILDHGLPVMIVGIVCIAILFIIRKYLFINLKEKEDQIYQGKQLVLAINKIMNSNLEVDNPEETLSEFMLRQFRNEDLTNIEPGMRVLAGDLVMTVISVNKEGQITKAELTRTKPVVLGQIGSEEE